MDINQAEICPGTTGILFEDTPKLTTACVRPFAWAILLYRGATRPSEVAANAALVCSNEDLKVANWEEAEEDECRTWAEVCAEEALGEMLATGLCRYVEHWLHWRPSRTARCTADDFSRRALRKENRRRP